MEEEAKILLRTLIYKPRDEGIQRLIRMRDEALQSALTFYEDVLKGIEPKYHSQFIMLTETGEASPEFLGYLDNNEQAQKACEMVFEAHARSLHKALQSLRKDCLDRLAQEEAEAWRVRS